MWRRVRPPLVVVAMALLASIVLLAVLQYRWLGQISEAERAQRRTTLSAGANEFAQDFDREIARAYLLFQAEPPTGPANPEPDDRDRSERFAARYDRWQATARFPRLLKELYTFAQSPAGATTLQRFDPATRQLMAAEWPASMSDWAEHLTTGNREETSATGGALVIRRMPPAIWDSVPAIVVPVPFIFFGRAQQPDFRVAPSFSYSILVLDRDYVSRELLPSLAERHFGHAESAGVGAGLDFKVAVVSRRAGDPIVFQSSTAFAPAIDAPADATADLFQVRTQDFSPLAAEVRRFTSFATTTVRTTTPARGRSGNRLTLNDGRPLSILIEPGAPPSAAPAKDIMTSTHLTTGASAPRWKLLVTHPAGSLEAAVNAQRRRNLAISSSILGLLGASMAMLVLSTRRAQRLARQQMEFVAAVSHELRTPLAVIRSAAENLADGVVHDETKIRRYGELMRSEGRRLTEMVEQILEFAGIQSGQRGFALRAVAIEPLLRDIVSASSSLIAQAGVSVEFDIAPDLPAVLGDEPALRRVFQNLIDNAIKYGASGGWMGVSARASGSTVSVRVADRGIGIEPAEQSRIFQPFYRAADVVAAQMQGAGLGLSLVQRIVLAHGGQVTVTSTPRAGSEFVVQLPAAGDVLAPDAISVNPPASALPRGVGAPRYS